MPPTKPLVVDHISESFTAKGEKPIGNISGLFHNGDRIVERTPTRCPLFPALFSVTWTHVLNHSFFTIQLGLSHSLLYLQTCRKTTGCISSPFLASSPDRTGSYKMYALNSKVLLGVVCALAVAVVLMTVVSLSIDPGSLSAEMPWR